MWALYTKRLNKNYVSGKMVWARHMKGPEQAYYIDRNNRIAREVQHEEENCRIIRGAVL